jgi:hypothetical protein
LFARAPCAQIKAKVCLFHAKNHSNLRALVKSIDGEF